MIKPLISIIVPVYNAEKYLVKCLDSLVSQTYNNIEILLINDGSKDNSGNICDEFAQKDNRVRVVHKENGGVSSARNIGLDIAQGEYIGFVDSDDWVEPDMYECLYSFIVGNGADVSICKFSNKDERIEQQNYTETIEFDAKSAILEMHKDGLFAGHLCNKLFKIKLFEGLRFDEQITIYEDMLLVWDLFYRSKKIIFGKTEKYHYILNNNSAMYGKICESYFSVRKACLLMREKMVNFFKDSLIYADRTIIFTELVIAKKLYICKQFTKHYYKNIQEIIKKYYNKKVRKLFDFKEKLQIITLKNSYVVSKVLFYLIEKRRLQKK